jgi:hypothetical protein
MPTEFTVSLRDDPGTLARLGEVLRGAGIDVEAIAGSSRGGRSHVQFVCDAAARTRETLEAAGIPCATREVLVVRVLDGSATLADVALVMARAGIGIDSIYLTTRGHLVLGVDDLPAAAQVAGSLAGTIQER